MSAHSSCRARIEDITEIIPKKLNQAAKKSPIKLTVFLNQKNQILLIKQKKISFGRSMAPTRI